MSTSPLDWVWSEMDTTGVLQDPTGALVAWDDDGGDGMNFMMTVPDAGAEYFLDVAGFDVDTAGDYELVLVTTPMLLTDRFINAYQVETLSPQSPEHWWTGYINAPGEKTVYRIELAEEVDAFRVQSHGELDVLATLFAEDGSWLDQDDDSGADYNFQIEATGPGVFYLEVGPYSDALGSYGLQFEVLDAE